MSVRRLVPDIDEHGELHVRCWYCEEIRPEQLVRSGRYERAEYHVCDSCLKQFERERRARIKAKRRGAYI